MIKSLFNSAGRIVVLLFMTYSVIYGQKHNFHAQEYGLKDGLSSYNLSCIYQDSRGFMWFATADYGLNRYDGHTFKTYTKEENGLCNNCVYSVTEDAKGNFWLVCGGRGVSHCHVVFDPIQEKVYSLSEYTGLELPFEEHSALSFPMVNGSIMYIINAEKPGNRCRYYEYDGAMFQEIFTELDITNTSFALPEVAYKLEDGNYAVLCFHEQRVVVLNKKGQILKECRCPNMRLDGLRHFNSSVYVACDDGYTLSFFKNGEGALSASLPLGIGRRETIQGDRGYHLTMDSFFIYDRFNNPLVALKTDRAINNFTSPIAVDKDENVWTRNDDVLLLMKALARPLTVDLSSETDLARWRGMTTMNDGRIVVGGYSTIKYKYLNDSVWQDLDIKSTRLFPHNYLGVASDDSKLWLGTERGLLLCYDWEMDSIKEYAFYNRKEAAAVVMLIWQPFIAKNGSLWLGTSAGLFYFDKEQDKVVVVKDSTYNWNETEIYALHENEEGLWLSTNKGLLLFDMQNHKLIEHFSSKHEGENYIPSSHIAHLYEDQNGIFWLATKGEGLIRWNPKTRAYKQYTQNGAGLSHNLLYAVYGDDYGHLWLSSQRGLMQFDIETESVRVYLKEDGLKNNEFNTISHHKAADGRLFFGGQNGVVHFNPADFQDTTKGAPLVITEYTKESISTGEQHSFMEALLEQKKIVLNPDDKSFYLEFALLDYVNSNNHQYSYKIEGYDNNWVYQSEHSIKINVLPYGTYQLKLRAKSANGSAWVVYPHPITIDVLKPFYLQTWFIVLIIVLIAIAIYSAVQWRIKQLEQRKVELEQVVKERTAQIEKDKAFIEEQAEELKVLDKVKSKFFANISHELRTPLTLILGPLSYILDNPEDLDKQSIQKTLQVMQRNGKSLMQLIEEILDLSKLEANKLELVEEPTPVEQFFEYIFAVFEPQFQQQELDYSIYFQLQEKEIVVLMDRKKMERVLNNFLSNALKFTPKKGQIRIVIIEEEKRLKIAVSDTGKGIHPDDLPHVFERFYQSKLAEQKLYGGTGIGLALVNELAALMEGRAYVESVLGEGSSFYFELPKKIVVHHETAVVMPSIVEEEEALINIGTDFTILLVEDNRDMRDFVSQLLEAKYTVITAENGLEGIAVLKDATQKVDLIVSDVMMPEMDGFTFLKEVKSNENWYKIPVIMLTALAAERDKLTALTIGVDDYLTKPFSVPELLVRIQNLLYNYCQRLSWQASLIIEEPIEGEAEHLKDQTQVEGLSAANRSWIANLETLVKDSLNEKVVDVEALAGLVFLSKRQLHRKVKEITGLTPAKFIKEVQLQAARRELESGTALSITEVAFNNAFEFPATFSTVFKKRFGVSPSDYLKRVESN